MQFFYRIKVAVFVLFVITVSSFADVLVCNPEMKQYGFDKFRDLWLWDHFYKCSDGSTRVLTDAFDSPEYSQIHYACSSLGLTGPLFLNKPDCAIEEKKYKERHAKNKKHSASMDFAYRIAKKYRECLDSFEEKALEHLANGDKNLSWKNLGLKQQTYSIDGVHVSLEGDVKGCENCLVCREPEQGYGVSVSLGANIANCLKGTTITNRLNGDTLTSIDLYPSEKTNECTWAIARDIEFKDENRQWHLSKLAKILRKNNEKEKEKKEKEASENKLEKIKANYTHSQKILYSLDSTFMPEGRSRIGFNGSLSEADLLDLFWRKHLPVVAQSSKYPSFLNLKQNRQNVRLEFLVIANWNALDGCKESILEAGFENKDDSLMIPIDKYEIKSSDYSHPWVKVFSIPLSDYSGDFDWSGVYAVKIKTYDEPCLMFGIGEHDRTEIIKIALTSPEGLQVVSDNEEPVATESVDLNQQDVPMNDISTLQRESLNNDNDEIVEDNPKQEKASAVAESAKQNDSDNSMSTTKLLRIGVFSAVALGGGIAALVFDKKAKKATATPPTNRAEFQKGHDDAKQNQNVRNVSLGVAAAGLVALGLTFLF